MFVTSQHHLQVASTHFYGFHKVPIRSPCGSEAFMPVQIPRIAIVHTLGGPLIGVAPGGAHTPGTNSACCNNKGAYKNPGKPATPK